MKISKLLINNFKNINNLNISLDTKDYYCIVIGNNGSGKSNILEALSLIFKNFFLGDRSTFQFEIEYLLLNGTTVRIESDDKKKYNVFINDGERNYSKSLVQEIFPENILFYYSGHYSRTRDHFSFAYKNYIKDLDGGFFRRRHFFYLGPEYFPLLLLSVLGSELDYMKEMLREHVKINEIVEFSLVFDKNRSGKVVGFLKSFLEVLNHCKTKETVSTDQIIFHFEGSDSLNNIIKNQAIGYDRDLFKYLDAALCSGLLKEVTINLRLTNGKEISLWDLSEGEQQRVILYSIVEFFGHKNTLYLLDEPDTSFHPKWQQEFIPRLNELEPKTQFFITTHSPLLLSNIEDENILLIDDGKTYRANSNGSLGRDVNSILREFMEVSERPVHIMKLIKNFNKYIAIKKFDEAKTILKELEGKIDSSDPFFIEANSTLIRYGASGK